MLPPYHTLESLRSPPEIIVGFDSVLSPNYEVVSCACEILFIWDGIPKRDLFVATITNVWTIFEGTNADVFVLGLIVRLDTHSVCNPLQPFRIKTSIYKLSY